MVKTYNMCHSIIRDRPIWLLWDRCWYIS